ncbi:HD domain-containing protein [Nitratireductor sp. L15S-10]|uniref:HD domain-containing protein n=1 Tax=Nitratireductor sp. L15S-10 TaxID=3034028 RepID=UPI003857E1FC
MHKNHLYAFLCETVQISRHAMTAQDQHPRNAAMGTLAWGQGRDGSLTSTEKIRLIGNLAYVQIRERFDTMRCRLGLLVPAQLELESILPPNTALVEDALGLASETHQDALFYHSWRTYLFGALIAAHERLAYDPSLFFAAAILHDIGLTEHHEPHLCSRCFALSGGERVRAHLRSKGHAETAAQKVGNAIALHLNGWVSARTHGAEAHLVSRGAVCDLFGAGRHRIAPATLSAVLERFPRNGVIEALQFGTARHKESTRPAVMTSLSRGKAPAEPF